MRRADAEFKRNGRLPNADANVQTQRVTTSAADGRDNASNDDGKDILQQGRLADHGHGSEQTATELNNNERTDVRDSAVACAGG
jgi:hypothetical protein